MVLIRRVRDRLAKRARNYYKTVNSSKGTVAYEAYLQAQRAYLQTKRAARKEIIKQVKTRYREEQLVADIVRQLNGELKHQSD